MSEEASLQELLSLWDRHRAEGRDVPAAERCRDRPEMQAELQRRIALRQGMGRLADATTETGPAPAASPPSTKSGGAGPLCTVPWQATPPGHLAGTGGIPGYAAGWPGRYSAPARP